MALTANRDLDHYIDQQLRSFAAADEHIFKGSFLSVEAGGYVAPLTALEAFAGIAYEECDNSEGDDGDVRVKSYTQGDFVHALTGAALSNIGDIVYASADNGLTFTSTDNTPVGCMVDLVSTDKILLRINPFIVES